MSEVEQQIREKEYMPYDPKNMPFRRLGPSGLRVPLFSLGGWLTLGGSVVGDSAKDIIKLAFENGVNMIDVAESYSGGKCEMEVGRVIKELNIRRTDLVICTKIFFGVRKGPNDRGLSRKHIIEGVKESLGRLQMDYVDVIFAHRPDDQVPMEEIVRAFNFVIDQGWAFYWATSEWSAQQIEEAHHVASRCHLIAPIAEQCKHHMFARDRAENEYIPLYKKYGMSTTVFSALAGGLLSGKYNDGVPPNSRFAKHPDFYSGAVKKLEEEGGKEEIEKVKKLTELAKEEFDVGPTALALAFIAVQPQTSTVILGASSAQQLSENLQALDVIEKLKQKGPKAAKAIMEKVEAILDNRPSKNPRHIADYYDAVGLVGW